MIDPEIKDHVEKEIIKLNNAMVKLHVDLASKVNKNTNFLNSFKMGMVFTVVAGTILYFVSR